MKKTLLLAYVASLFAATTTVSCGDKKKSDDIIAPKVEAPKPKAPIRMQDYGVDKDIEWLGKSYHVEIRRTADDSLQMVKDDTGQKYVDNKIALRVIRSDGSVFFHKTFTKADFTSALDDSYRRMGILEGLVFDTVKGTELRFAASVCNPQSEDEYIPLIVKLDNFGNTSISRDTQLDTSGNSEDEDEDGV